MNRSMDVKRLGLFVVGVLASQVALAAPLDNYWPQFRHDAAHTNYSPGKGALNAPAVKWRLPLGGNAVAARLVDVDLDGADDVVSIEGGRVTARAASGNVLWSSPQLAAMNLAAIGDVDGDGILDIAVGALNRAHVVRSSDGAVLWSSAPQTPSLGFLALADFDADGVLDVAVSAGQGGAIPQPTTQIIGFYPAQKVIATTAQLASADETSSVAGQCVVDIDGDGAPDLLLPGYQHFYAFSGKTGQLLGKSSLFNTIGQPPLACTAIQPDPTKPPIVLFAADVAALTYLWHGVAALQLQNGALQLLWSDLMPEATTQRYDTLPGAIADLDNDGVAEVLASKFDKGAWQLEARDAATGAVLHTVSAAQMPGNGVGGPVLRGVVRIAAGATATLIVQQADAAAAANAGALTLWQWTRKGGFVQFASVGNGIVSQANWQRPGHGEFIVHADAVPVLQPWGAAPANTGDLLILRDLAGDGVPDGVEDVRITAAGQTSSAGKEPMANTQILGVAAMAGGQPNTLVIGHADGRVPFLIAETLAGAAASTNKLANDANNDGLADLRYGGLVNAYVTVAPVQDSDNLGRILVAHNGKVQLLTTDAAGPMTPPTVQLTVADAGQPAEPFVDARGSFADVNGDGQREIVVRGTTAKQVVSLTAWPLSGPVATLWSYVHPNGPWAWGGTEGDPFVIADVNGDGADDLVCEWDLLGAAGQNQLVTAISGKTGTELWPPDAKCQVGYTAFSVDVTSTPRRILSSDYNSRYGCDASTGAIVASDTNKSPSYGVPMLTDLDGDGVVEQIIAGSGEGLTAEKTVDFKTLWKFAVPGAYHAPGALVLAGAEPLAAHASLAQPTIQVVTAKAGVPVWAYGYVAGKQVTVADAAATGFATVGLLAAADLTGAGHPSLLFRTTEGYLYCVNALTGAVDWALGWGGAFGDPIVADVDGDGQLEMLAMYSDGSLYAFDHSNLPAVAWVRENAGNGPALDDASDIDAQEDTRTLHVNWAADAGALGYAVSVLDQNGGTVLAPQSFGAVTEATLTGLTMHLNEHYVVAVQAYADQAFAPTTLSDGVTIVDLSPPWIDGQLLQPAAVAAGQTVQIVADLHDKTAVHDWRVTVTAAGGTAPVWQQKANAAQPDVHLQLAWATQDGGKALPAGDYVVHVEVHDGAQHSAAVDMTLHICDGTPFSVTACNAGDVTADGYGSGGDASSLPQSAPDGCGCRITTATYSVPPGAALFAAACVWVLWRARRSRVRR